ncbi:MAG: hypothetical protein ACU833_11410 [Gammaproteobacteria bacterium]
MQNLKLIASFCFFRNGPEDLSKSVALLRKTIYFYILVLSIGQIIILDPVAALIKVSIEVSITLFFIWLVLLAKHKTYLFLQLSSAFIGCQTFLGTIALPLLAWVSVAEAGEILIPFYSLVFMLIWLIDVLIRLLKKTLGIGFAAALYLVLPYLLAAFGGSFLFII